MAPRVGIAGYGLAGRYFHAPLLKAADFEVVGALTTKSDRKAAAISDFPEISVVERMTVNKQSIDDKPHAHSAKT